MFIQDLIPLVTSVWLDSLFLVKEDVRLICDLGLVETIWSVLVLAGGNIYEEQDA